MILALDLNRPRKLLSIIMDYADEEIIESVMGGLNRERVIRTQIGETNVNFSFLVDKIDRLYQRLEYQLEKRSDFTKVIERDFE